MQMGDTLIAISISHIPMRTIPITPSMLTGRVLEAFHDRHLDGRKLAAWADALLDAGFDSGAIIEAVVDPEMHWQRIPGLFTQICCDVGLCPDVASEVAALKQEVMIEEYRRGYRNAAELLFRFEDLRKRIGFPEMVIMRLLEDNDDDTNDSGFYGSDSGKHGTELEALVRTFLERAGIRP